MYYRLIVCRLFLLVCSVQVFDFLLNFNNLLRSLGLLLKLIRIVLMPVFLTRDRLKGRVLPALARQSGYSPPSLFKGGIGRGVEKHNINFLLTFVNNVDLSLKFFDLKSFFKNLHTA